jgi:hypothetical protein
MQQEVQIFATRATKRQRAIAVGAAWRSGGGCREVQREVQILATGVTKAKSHYRCGRVLWATTPGVVPRSLQILKSGKMAKKNTDS